MVIPKNSASSNPPKLKLLSISIQTATSMTDRPGWGKSLASIASFPAGAEHRLDIGGGREELHCRVVHIGCCRARGEGEPHQQHDKRRGRYEFGGAEGQRLPLLADRHHAFPEDRGSGPRQAQDADQRRPERTEEDKTELQSIMHRPF